MNQDYSGQVAFSWQEIESLVEVLCTKIRQIGFKFNQIATVTRGGLVPARLVADIFDIKKILVDQNNIPPNTLFVDDIYDTGDTFKEIFPKVDIPESFVYATLIARKGKTYPKQLIYAQTTMGMEYVVFPWDKLEHSRKEKTAT